MTVEQITTITLYLHVTGGLLAIFLYAGLGKVFWIPMAIDYVYWHMAGLIIDMDQHGYGTFIVYTTYVTLLHIWVIYLSGITKYRWGMIYLFLIIMFASFIGFGSGALAEIIGEQELAEILGFPYWENETKLWLCAEYVAYESWSLFSFLLILSVLVYHTLWKRIRGDFSDFLVDPRRRILIPILLLTGVTSFTPVMLNYAPETIGRTLNNIVGSMMGWTWVALELPFYIMYRRMLKHYPNLSRRDFR